MISISSTPPPIGKIMLPWTILNGEMANTYTSLAATHFDEIWARKQISEKTRYWGNDALTVHDRGANTLKSRCMYHPARFSHNEEAPTTNLKERKWNIGTTGVLTSISEHAATYTHLASRPACQFIIAGDKKQPWLRLP